MKNRRENGEVVIEASIVVTVALMFITVMLYIGIALYQQTMLTAVANQTATEIAQVYSNNLKDVFTGYVDTDGVYESFSISNAKDDAYVLALENKADALAKFKVRSLSIIKPEISEVEVQLVSKPNELLKSQIIVTIKDKYNIPLAALFSDGDTGLQFTVSGRADCVDIIEYVNGVDAIGDPENSNIEEFSETCTVLFIADRSVGKAVASVQVEKGLSIASSVKYTSSVMPVDPRSDTKTFSHWVTESNSRFLATTTVTSDMIVYGAWKCNVTLDATEGSFSSGKTQTLTVNEGQRVNFPMPTRSGYAFDGWFTEKNGGGSLYRSNDTPVTGHITLYAKWRCTHTMKLVSTDRGTCVKDNVQHYKCERCPYTEDKNNGRGDHNFVATGVTGDRCYNRYYVKSCTYCGQQRQGDYAGNGKHTYEISSESNGRCNVPHGVNGFRCSSQGVGADGLYKKCGTSTANHFTCKWCGSHYIYYKNGYSTCVMRCGTHGQYFQITGCGYGGIYK